MSYSLHLDLDVRPADVLNALSRAEAALLEEAVDDYTGGGECLSTLAAARLIGELRDKIAPDCAARMDLLSCSPPRLPGRNHLKLRRTGITFAPGA